LIPGMKAGDQKGLFAKSGASFKKGDTICRMPHQKWKLSKSSNLHQSPLDQLKGDKETFLTRISEDAIVTVQTIWPKQVPGGKFGVSLVWSTTFSSEPGERPLFYAINHSNAPNLKLAIDGNGVKLVILCDCIDDVDECYGCGQVCWPTLAFR